MKKIAIILHANPAYAMDWKSLVRSDDPNTILCLIGNRASVKALSAEDRSAFAQVDEVNSFSFAELSPLIGNIGAEFFQASDQMHITAVTEFDVLVCAELRDHFRDKYNVVGADAATIHCFRDKLAMKAALAPAGVRMPRYEHFNRAKFADDVYGYVESLEGKLGYPMFVKPTDGASSVNTDLIESRDQLLAWMQKNASVQQEFEIDEYIDGDLFHCDSINENGEVKFTFVSQYLHPNADAKYGQPLATMTMLPVHPDYKRPQAFAENALRSFPTLPDGCTHLEVFRSKKNGELIFLEVGARPPGAWAPEMYQIRTGGVDLRTVHTRLNLGLSVDRELAQLQQPNDSRPYVAMWDIVSPEEGGVVSQLKSPTFSDQTNYTIKWRYQIGDRVPSRHSNLDVIGSVIFWNGNYDMLHKDFKSLDQQQLLFVAPQPSLGKTHAALWSTTTTTSASPAEPPRNGM